MAKGQDNKSEPTGEVHLLRDFYGRQANYADLVTVQSTKHEFTLGFHQTQHPFAERDSELGLRTAEEDRSAVCVSKIVLTPIMAVKLIEVLIKNIGKYQASHGDIEGISITTGTEEIQSNG